MFKFDLQLLGGGGGGHVDTSAANQASANQTQVLNQMDQIIAQLQQQYSSNFAPVLDTASSGLGALGGVAGGLDPSLLAELIGVSSDPALISALTGIDASALVGDATNYLMNPGGTGLAQQTPGALGAIGAAGAPALQTGQSAISSLEGPSSLSGVAPGGFNFFENEARQGINPRFAENAQNQLQQQFGQAESDIRAHAMPGSNPLAMEQSAENQLLGASTNLGAQLAGESQQFANQGEQGALGLAQGLDTSNMQRSLGAFGVGQGLNQTTIQDVLAKLQASGALDQQTMQMLLSGAGLGQGFNQQTFGDMATGQQAAMSPWSTILSFLGQGLSQQGTELGALGGMNNTFGSQAIQYTNMAQQAAQQQAANQNGLFGSLVNLGVGLLGAPFTGGATLAPGTMYGPGMPFMGL